MQNQSRLEDIAEKELTVLVQQGSDENRYSSYASKIHFVAVSCSAAEAKELIIKLTKQGTNFQVVRPIKTTVTINVELDPDD